MGYDASLDLSLVTSNNGSGIKAASTMQHETEIEVRYYETDGQGVVHHANYFKYFELARVKMLSDAGYDYAELERQGIMLVVHSIGCRYLLPATFGETLRIRTRVERATAARLDHSYQVFRGEELLAEGNSTLACITADGNVRRMPDFLIADHRQATNNSAT